MRQIQVHSPKSIDALSGDEIGLAVTVAEIRLFANGLNEALETIDAREFESRFGASRAEVNTLCFKLINLIPPAITPPQT